MFKNTYQSGFLSILYSIGCVLTHPSRLALRRPFAVCAHARRAARNLARARCRAQE